MISFAPTFAELLYRVARRLREGAVFPRTYRTALILDWIARRTHP